jgi:hypothetical protein
VSGVSLADVSFVNKEAKVWGCVTSVNELIDAVEDVGFEAMLAGAGGGPNDIRSVTPGTKDDSTEVGDEEKPDIIFIFKNPINPISDPIVITNLLLQADGVMNVTVECNGNGDVLMSPHEVHVWGCVDVEDLREVLKNANYPVKILDVSSVSNNKNKSEECTRPFDLE